ncbi:unnamed protein product [Toxocara canis]|uniref:C2H2-type domain-containing protein n=1 Tax=Toxocara canis TaxID=6265 RepID=A0A183VEB4_TOXCA|nr:unnamed protein product [Toxocara canis]
MRVNTRQAPAYAEIERKFVCRLPHCGVPDKKFDTLSAWKKHASLARCHADTARKISSVNFQACVRSHKLGGCRRTHYELPELAELIEDESETSPNNGLWRMAEQAPLPAVPAVPLVLSTSFSLRLATSHCSRHPGRSRDGHYLCDATHDCVCSRVGMYWLDGEDGEESGVVPEEHSRKIIKLANVDPIDPSPPERLDAWVSFDGRVAKPTTLRGAGSWHSVDDPEEDSLLLFGTVAVFKRPLPLISEVPGCMPVQKIAGEIYVNVCAPYEDDLQGTSFTNCRHSEAGETIDLRCATERGKEVTRELLSETDACP